MLLLNHQLYTRWAETIYSMDKDYILDGQRLYTQWAKTIYSMDKDYILNGQRLYTRWAIRVRNKSVFSVKSVGDKKHSCSFGGISEKI